MTAAILTLAEFLLARIAERAADAERSKDHPWLVGHTMECDSWGDVPGDCTCGAADRVRAECEAKRQIVESCRAETLESADAGPEEWMLTFRILRYLALPFADHPDYREEWRP